MTGYTTLELLFRRWRWVRRLSRVRWVRLERSGYGWVKLDTLIEMANSSGAFLNAEKFMNHPDYEAEDWRLP